MRLRRVVPRRTPRRASGGRRSARLSRRDAPAAALRREPQRLVLRGGVVCHIHQRHDAVPSVVELARDASLLVHELNTDDEMLADPPEESLDAVRPR